MWTSILPFKLGENQAEAKIVVAIVGAIVVAVRHTAVLRIVVPATATVHAVRPFGYYPLFKEHNRFSSKIFGICMISKCY